VSLVHSIIESIIESNAALLKNKEISKLAELNKYVLLRKKHKRRKFKIIRKIKHWKN